MHDVCMTSLKAWGASRGVDEGPWLGEIRIAEGGHGEKGGLRGFRKGGAALGDILLWRSKR